MAIIDPREVLNVTVMLGHLASKRTTESSTCLGQLQAGYGAEVDERPLSHRT